MRLPQRVHLRRRQASPASSPSVSRLASMSGIPAIAPGISVDWPRAASHRFINRISSCCDRADPRAQRQQFLVVRMRRHHRRHLHRLRMMHDHALHKIHIRLRPLRRHTLRIRRQFLRRLTRCPGLHDRRRSARSETAARNSPARSQTQFRKVSRIAQRIAPHEKVGSCRKSIGTLRLPFRPYKLP